MKLKWGNESIKGFSKPFIKAERDNDWTWWGLYIVFVIMAVVFVIKIG